VEDEGAGMTEAATQPLERADIVVLLLFYKKLLQRERGECVKRKCKLSEKKTRMEKEKKEAATR